MAGSVDQIEDVGLAVLGRIGQPHGLRLDGDAALASISMGSSTCSFISRAANPPVVWIGRSASVDLPWSICAIMAKLRMLK
jgi:hypothetical protein